MSDGFDINALRQVIEAYDQRAAALATGDQELQAQRAQISENTSTLVAQVNQIEATQQHLAELQRELSVLRGEVVTQDQAFMELPYIEATAARWGLIDTLHVVSSRLQGWGDINARLFTATSARQVMLQCSKLLKAQHDRLVGARGGATGV